jgi:uncharacterized protein with von Willebrand factor type A (vWA) domain
MTLTLRLTDGRTVVTETSETVEEFVQAWKAALKDSGVLVVGDGDTRECIAAAQIVSVR